jgi:hypothetical protein
MENSEEKTAHIKSFDDLGFTVKAIASEYVVDYTIFDVFGRAADDGAYYYPAKGWTRTEDVTTVLDDATVFASGAVKWSGCSDWYFDEQDNYMIHGCSRHDLERIGLILAACWDWTAELCPKWNPQ